ncbi:MAG: MBL fold metallo-hydrolase [Ruminococcaceae bacterium]|nr:MBL fold metallo-hydrolase [Oscillospiraceae bacterium]
MKKSMRILLCVLSLLLVVVLAVACDKTPDEPDTTTEATTQSAPNCDAGHTYEVSEVIKQATCVEAGKQKLKCSVCGDQKEEDIAATGVHTPKSDWEVVLAATCAQDGKQVKKCSVCDAQLEEQTIAATGNHVKGERWETVLVATATAEGRRAQRCTGCGLEMATKSVTALGKEVTVNAGSTTTTVNLASHTAVYDGAVKTKLFSATVNDLANLISSGVTVTTIRNTPVENAVSTEILIGETDRPESAAALALVNGNGFAITVSGNKIAIVGTTPAETIYGVNYFINNYLSGASATLPTSVVGSTTAEEVLSSNSFGHTLVFSDKLDNDKGSDSSKDARDYNCIAADNLANGFATQSGLNVSVFTKKSDANSVADKEILIGEVDRLEFMTFLRTLDANEYGIMVKDGKVMLAAWNTKGMETCVAEFEKLLKDIKTTSGGAKYWNIPDGFYAKGVVSNDWIVDFPRPDEAQNIDFTRSIDANNGSLQFLYTGSGVNATAFEAYCQKLTAAGYTMVTTNTIENSIFRLYVNEAKGTVLNVAYNDYKYAADYFSEEKKAETGKLYVEYEKSIRVTSSPIDSIVTPSGSLINKDTNYVKVADSTMSSVGLEANLVGMCYIIRLEDGSFIVYDGGNSGAYSKIWSILIELHTQAYGSAPSASNPIRVSAWIITHSHTDHFAAFSKFLTEYGKDAAFRMDYLIGSFPAQNTLYATGSRTEDIATLGKEGQIEALQAKVNNGGAGTFKFIEAFSGQRLYFANLEIEVLMTYEDHPASFYHSNDSCTITRLTINSTSATKGATVSGAAEGYKTTALILADANPGQSRYMCAMYGSYMQSDIVQLAHHGNIGCEIELYAAARPTVVLWPHANAIVGQWKDPDKVDEAAHIKVNVFVCHELDSVKYIFSSDTRYCVTLKLTSNGPDYAVYDAFTGNKIVFNKNTIIDKSKN